jgi:hypothetical protein
MEGSCNPSRYSAEIVQNWGSETQLYFSVRSFAG